MNRLKKVFALMPMLALFHTAVVSAGPEEYVSTPIVEEGEKEIDFKFGTQKSGDTNRVSAATLGFGYGVNSWWFTELYGKYKRQSPDGTKFVLGNGKTNSSSQRPANILPTSAC